MAVDLEEVAQRLIRDPEGRGPTLWVVSGRIFTEIEALRVLAGVEAFPVASGGIGGAEGAVWFGKVGEQKQLEGAEAAHEDVRGEPPVVES